MNRSPLHISFDRMVSAVTQNMYLYMHSPIVDYCGTPGYFICHFNLQTTAVPVSLNVTVCRCLRCCLLFFYLYIMEFMLLNCINLLSLRESAVVVWWHHQELGDAPLPCLPCLTYCYAADYVDGLLCVTLTESERYVGRWQVRCCRRPCR